MKFEVDLIRYVIDIAIIRGTFFRSKDLNADWLPFANIIEVFEDICVKLGVSKDTEDRCYKALLKMSASDEKHLTWAYKMKNINKYLPSKSSAHSAKHTTNSWTKHKLKFEGTALTALFPKGVGLSNSKKTAGFGINLGRLSDRPNMDESFGILSRLNSTTSSPIFVQHAEFGNELRKEHGSHNLEVSSQAPPCTPIPPPTHNDSSAATPPSAVPYYQSYIPSSRISTIVKATPSRAGTPQSVNARQSSHFASPPPPPPSSTENGRFGEEAIRAMHNRVVSIELEAKKTRQLLAHIAYLRSHSRSSRLEEFARDASFGFEDPGIRAAEGHTRHVDYGELELSPYLKQVLDLPPAVITTDIYEPSPSHAQQHMTDFITTQSAAFRSHSTSQSPKSSDHTTSPKGMRFSLDNRQKGSSRLTSGSPKNCSAEGHESPHPSSQHKRSPSPSGQVMSAVRAEYEQAQQASSSHSSHLKHFQFEREFQSPRQQHAAHVDYANSLRSSPAMQKYAPHSPVPQKSSTQIQAVTMQRGSAEHQAYSYLNSLAELSPHSSDRSSERRNTAAAALSSGYTADSFASPTNHTKSAHAGKDTPTVRRNLVVNTSTPTRSSVGSALIHSFDGCEKSSDRLRSSGNTPRTPPSAVSTPHAENSVQPSPPTLSSSPPSLQYRNSCKLQRSEQAEVTVIDSQIDDLLGDSLNIEEKDGRVYVHFQSKFVLPGGHE